MRICGINDNVLWFIIDLPVKELCGYSQFGLSWMWQILTKRLGWAGDKDNHKKKKTEKGSRSLLGMQLTPLTAAPSWLVSSVGRALHRYRRGHGFKSYRPEVFSGLIFTTAQVVFITAKIAFIFMTPLYSLSKRYFWHIASWICTILGFCGQCTHFGFLLVMCWTGD